MRMAPHLATGITVAEPEANGKPRTKKERAAAAAAAAAALPRYERVTTTVGRVLLYEIVPQQLPFKIVNRVMGKKQLGDLIDSCYRACGQKETVFSWPTSCGRSATPTRPKRASRSASTTCRFRRKTDLLETAQKDVQEIRGAVHRGSHHRRRALQQGGRHLGRRSRSRLPKR